MKTTRRHALTLVLLAGLLAGCGSSGINLHPIEPSDPSAPSVSPAKSEAIDSIGAHPGNKTTNRKELTPAPKSPPAASPSLAPIAVGPAATPVPPPPYRVQPNEVLTTIATKQGVPDSQKDAWISDLLRLNKLLEARVQSGQVLQLPPVPVYIPQPVLQLQPVVIQRTSPAATATSVATATKTPSPTPTTPSVAASAATATPKPANVVPSATPTKIAATPTNTPAPAMPTKTPVVATPTKTPANVIVATPTVVKPAIIQPSATPLMQAQPTATKTPYTGNGGGPTLCNDGWVSPSSGSGTCSGHGGIKK